MCAAGQLNGYLFRRDDDPRAGIEEATEELARLGVLVSDKPPCRSRLMLKLAEPTAVSGPVIYAMG